MSIDISKKYGIKNCVRINGEDDIPDFLRDVIKVDGESLVLDCLEGEERCPLGSVIAFEKLASGKMNVWNKANYRQTTLEIDGVFYEKPHKNTAIRITEMVHKISLIALETNLVYYLMAIFKLILVGIFQD